MKSLKALSSDLSSLESSDSWALGALSNFDPLSAIADAWDGWTKIKCSDGSERMVLRDPNKAFELYGKNWSTNFKVVADVLNHAKVDVDAGIKVKIDKLFENLDYVEVILREAYRSSYLTYVGSICEKDALRYKHRMDKLTLAASMQLAQIKLLIDMNGVQDLDKLFLKVLEIQSRVADFIMKE